ncbi:MAG: polysaccharide biosynthesis protein [Sumerlaeia bacterium]
MVHTRWFRIALLNLIDAALLAFCWILAYALRFAFDIPAEPLGQGDYLLQMKLALPAVLILHLAAFWAFGVYRGMMRYASLQEAARIAAACAAVWLALVAFSTFLPGFSRLGDLPLHPNGDEEVLGIPRSAITIYFFVSVLFIGGLRFSRRLFLEGRARFEDSALPTLVVGAGDLAENALRDVLRAETSSFRPVCAVATQKGRVGARLQGVLVEGTIDDVERLIGEKKVESVLIALDEDDPAVLRKVVRQCQNAKVTFRIIPSMRDIAAGRVQVSPLREVRIEDLLGREPVNLALPEERNVLRGEVVLITGAGGSIGSELCRQVARARPEGMVLVGKGENSIYEIALELSRKHPGLPIEPVVADVRDARRMAQIFEATAPTVVFHAAAHKHVPLMEGQPTEAVKNNVVGTSVMAFLAKEYAVKRFLLISTDKAVRPASIMGATKRVAEMIVFSLARQAQAEGLPTRYHAVRFGNVLGSRGSVIPLFKRQIAEGGPVTVTHPDVVRYFMTIPEAVSLVLQANSRDESGVLFLLDMGEPVRISDLAATLITLSGLREGQDIEIAYTGLRPGEKLEEELLTETEDAEATEITKVWLARPKSIPEWEDAKELLARLQNAADRGSAAEILAILNEVVPDFAANPDFDVDAEERIAESASAKSRAIQDLLYPAALTVELPEETGAKESVAETEDAPQSVQAAAAARSIDAPLELKSGEIDVTALRDEDQSAVSSDRVARLDDLERGQFDAPDFPDDEPVHPESLEEPTPQPGDRELLAENETIDEIEEYAPPALGQDTESSSRVPQDLLTDLSEEDGPGFETREFSRFDLHRLEDRPASGPPAEEVAEALAKAQPLDLSQAPPPPAPEEPAAGVPAPAAIEPPLPPMEPTMADFAAEDQTTKPPQQDIEMTESTPIHRPPCAIFARVDLDPTASLEDFLASLTGLLGPDDRVLIPHGQATAHAAALGDRLVNLPEGTPVYGPMALNAALAECPLGAYLVVAPTSVRLAPAFFTGLATLAADEPDCPVIYADYVVRDANGTETVMELQDHQGCPHERFEFGPVIVYKSAALQGHDGFDETLKYAWEYDTHLKLMQEGEFRRIPQTAYTQQIPAAKEGDGRLHSPGQGPLGHFSYVFYPDDVEREVTTVFERALKEIGAWLDMPTHEVPAPEQTPEVTASVVMPILNREKYVGDAIQTVLDGTYQDFEILVVDNGSTDNTRDVVREFEKKDSRVKLLERNGKSIASALNEGIKAARGKYICQLDSDDLYVSDTLATMVNHLEAHPKCGLAVSWYRLTDPNGTILEDIPIVTHSGYTRNQLLRRDGVGAMRVFPRTVLVEMGYFDEKDFGNYGEDYDMALKVSEKYDVDRVKHVAYLVRRHPDNSDNTRGARLKYNNKNRARQRALHRRMQLVAQAAQPQEA